MCQIYLEELQMSPSSNFRDHPLRSWLPNTSLSALRQEMTDLVENFFGDSMSQMRGEAVPRVDVSETPDAVEIATDVPGYKRDQIHVEFNEKSVIITGTREEETEKSDEGRKYHKLERRSGSFTRTVWLPCPVDEEKVEARLADGILKIRLPKRVDPKRRQVEIKVDDHSGT